MKPSEIISLARRQTWCTLDIVSEEEAYHFLNFIIEDFWAEIRASDSWHWFDYLTINVQAGQPSYPFTKDNWYPMDENNGEFYNNFPIWKLEKVWYKLKNGKWRDLDIRFVDKIDVNDFPDQWEPEICFITNNYINLVPLPKEATQMQLWWYNYNQELQPDLWEITVGWHDYTRDKNNDVAWATYPFAWTHWNTTIFTDSEKPTSWTAYSTYSWTSAWSITWYDVTVFDKEDNIFIPKRWHYVIVEWMKYWMYGNMGANFEAARSNCRNFYDSEKMKALQNIMDRWQESDEPYFPELNFLNY